MSNLLPSYAQDKAIVDFIQGIDVVNHQLNHMRDRSGFFQRTMDGLSGKTYLRNLQNQQNLANGLEGCRQWLNEMTITSTTHATAIIRIQKILEENHHQFETFVDWSAGFKKQFLSFKTSANQAFEILHGRIDRLERSHESQKQLSRLMNQWDAGELYALSPLQKLYWVVDNLYWGPFGERNRLDLNDMQFHEDLKDLSNQLKIRLNKDLNAEDYVVRGKWIQGELQISEQQALLQYMGDWCWQRPEDSPTVFLASQWSYLEPDENAVYQDMPFHIAPVDLIINRMTSEVLKER